MDRIPRHKLRMFWTNQWSYGRTPEKWLELVKDQWYTNHTDINNLTFMNPTLNLLRWAVDKLYHEKKLNETQRQTMMGMLKSEDMDDVFMALTIMAELKPQKFKKL